MPALWRGRFTCIRIVGVWRYLENHTRNGPRLFIVYTSALGPKQVINNQITLTMKKTIFLFMACVITFSLASCGGNSTDNQKKSETEQNNDMLDGIGANKVEDTIIGKWEGAYEEDLDEDVRLGLVLASDGTGKNYAVVDGVNDGESSITWKKMSDKLVIENPGGDKMAFTIVSVDNKTLVLEDSRRSQKIYLNRCD